MPRAQPSRWAVGVGAQALEVVQDDRGAEPLGQPVHLVDQRRESNASANVGRPDVDRPLGRCAARCPNWCRRPATAGTLDAGPRRHPSRDARRASRRPTRAGGSSRALLTSTRNVAWKASWASCRSPSSRRQTASTIAPWRSISAVKAASAAAGSSRVEEAIQELAIGQPARARQAIQRAQSARRRAARPCRRHRGSPSRDRRDRPSANSERVPRPLRAIPRATRDPQFNPAIPDGRRSTSQAATTGPEPSAR